MLSKYVVYEVEGAKMYFLYREVYWKKIEYLNIYIFTIVI